MVNTLFTRLIITSFGAGLIIFGILYYNLNSTINTLHDRGLISQANDVVKFMKIDKAGLVTLHFPEELDKTYSNQKGNFAYAIIDINDNVLLSSREINTPLYSLNPHNKPSRPDYFQATDPETGNKIYGVTLHIDHNNQHYRVQVTQGSDHPDVLADSILEEFTEVTSFIIALLIFVVLVINVLTVRHAMKPLQIASQYAADIHPSRLDIRLPEDQIPIEILPLVQAVNAALERLEKGFQMQREFTADAAHHLRTPLSILSARIDKLSANQEFNALKSDIRAMSRVVGQLLKDAQLEIFILDKTEQADLTAIGIDVASELGPIAIKQDKSISVLGVDCPVIINGNTESLHLAVLNLVENALKHTPCKTSVEIIVSADQTISVRDYGSGIVLEDHVNVFQRFWCDNTEISGAGLGLSIVAKIIEAHHGHIKIIDKSPGCEFVITLP